MAYGLCSTFNVLFKRSTAWLGCKCLNLSRSLRVWRYSSSRSVCLHFIRPKAYATAGMAQELIAAIRFLDFSLVLNSLLTLFIYLYVNWLFISGVINSTLLLNPNCWRFLVVSIRMLGVFVLFVIDFCRTLFFYISVYKIWFSSIPVDIFR